MSVEQKFIKEKRRWTAEEHGQPITFNHEYVYCESTDEGAIPESELPENDYDENTGSFRRHIYFIADIEDDDNFDKERHADDAAAEWSEQHS